MNLWMDIFLHTILKIRYRLFLYTQILILCRIYYTYIIRVQEDSDGITIIHSVGLAYV